MPAKKFIDIYNKFEYRTNILVNEFEEKVDIADNYGEIFLSVHRSARSFNVVRLLALWGQFCQELIIRSALGGHYTISGVLLSKGASIVNRNSIRTIVLRRSNNRPPSWHIANFSIDVARNLGIQNYNQVSMSLGGTSPITHILNIRNFIVHPNEASRTYYESTLRNLNVPKTDPVNLLVNKVTGGASLFEQWIAELQNIAINSMQ